MSARQKNSKWPEEGGGAAGQVARRREVGQVARRLARGQEAGGQEAKRRETAWS